MTIKASFRIVPEPARLLTVARRAAILQVAVAAAPQTGALWGDLVADLVTLGRFDEALDTIERWPDADRSYRAQMHLAVCRLVPKNVPGNVAALAAAARAADLAQSSRERAAALGLRAKAERRLGDPPLARASLVAALSLDPANVDACKRLAALLVENGEVTAVLSLTDDLLGRGIAHPQVLNARAVALARSGRIDEARDVVGFDRFSHCTKLTPPPGFANLSAFNAAVATELLAHPAQRVDPHGSASRSTTRVDAPTSGAAPLATLMMKHLTRAVCQYVEALPDEDHPWLRARPAAGLVHGTCAITGPTGYETWHIHQQGWLSGVYYVTVPDDVSHGSSSAGCIVFGLDHAFAGADAARAYGETLVRPREGLLMLFPSHAYHRTYAHGLNEPRICTAFDLWPA